MGRGVKGAAGALRAGGKVRRGRQVPMLGPAALFFFTIYIYVSENVIPEVQPLYKWTIEFLVFLLV